MIRLGESLASTIDLLDEYGVNLRHDRIAKRILPAQPAAMESGQRGLERTARWLAIGSGITIGLAAGLIAISYFRSRR